MLSIKEKLSFPFGIQGALIALCLLFSSLANRRLPEPQRSCPHVARNVGLVCAVLATVLLDYAGLTIPLQPGKSFLQETESRPYAEAAIALVAVGGAICGAEMWWRSASVGRCDRWVSHLEQLAYGCCFFVFAIPIWMVFPRVRERLCVELPLRLTWRLPNRRGPKRWLVMGEGKLRCAPVCPRPRCTYDARQTALCRNSRHAGRFLSDSARQETFPLPACVERSGEGLSQRSSAFDPARKRRAHSLSA